MPRRLRRHLGTLADAARNARDLLRHGRLAAPYAAPYDEVARGPVHRLRRYRSDAGGPLAGATGPLLLVPPLMISTEVYDISPELSAVAFLARLGVDVWVVDYGAPEREDAGLRRTLDDHVLAVDAAIDAARAETGRDVHLSGYSQGGMFCYQAAAYRRSAGVASLVTFGSPVDVRKVLPVPVADPLIDRVLRWVRAGIDAPLEGLEGLPGAITSTGFKVFSARKELEQVATFFRLLHDREALERREPARRFLGGEGFVAWPGPAFKDFVDQLVVENRLTRGGLLIGDRAVSLADLTVPVLSFVGTKDEMARPPSVRAIRTAAPRAEHHEVTVPAGHFGLVVGSRALSITWPTVAEWMAWRDADGPKPARLDARATAPVEEADGDAESMYELAVQAVDGVWDRLGEAGVEAAGLFHALRWELPRLARLESLREGEQVGLGRTLRQQAQALGDRPFLLWEGRATSWAQVDARVDRAVDALVRDGVEAGAEVALVMGPHPDHLAALLAINRLGAVAVVTAPGDGAAGVDAPALLRRRPPPAEVPRDAGRGFHVALALHGAPSPTGRPRSRDTLVVTNRRWATSALATAAACQLTPQDTVWCGLPWHHPSALLVALGGALVGGCRLGCGAGADGFWDEVRRAGATVAVYDGPLLRALAGSPVARGEEHHPLRALVGSGADAETWEVIRRRFGGVRILEFHAAAGGAAVLANLDGTKPGSVGRPFPGSAWVALARTTAAGALVRRSNGRVEIPAPDEPGTLLVRIEAGRALGVAADDDPEVGGAEIVRGAFEPQDRWIVTTERLRRDADGDWWRA